MPRLSYSACRSFVLQVLPRFCKEGVAAPLREFAQSDNGPAGRASRSLYRFMRKGKSFSWGLTKTKPPFPLLLVSLLRDGITKSVLDYVASDILKIYQEENSEIRLRQRLAILARSYRARPDPSCLNFHCATGDLEKLLAHAEIEHASEVTLHPKGSQVFLGVKTITLDEGATPTNQGLIALLTHAAKTNTPMTTGRGLVEIKKPGSNSFHLFTGQVSLVITVFP